MKTFKGCIECFKNQISKTIQLINLDKEKKELVTYKVNNFLSNIDFNQPPAVIGGEIYKILHNISGNFNPYKEIKHLYIQKAKKLIPFLEKEIKNSINPLKTASKIAGVGNVIDFGINNNKHLQNDFNLLIKNLLKKEYYIDHFNIFHSKLEKAKLLLYIGDNAGESVFDMLFIKEIKNRYKTLNIIFVTRGSPIINDVIFQDAKESEIDKYAKIVSSGVDTPGLILNKTNTEFQNIFNNADLILSKGQGNFEGLSESKKEIFFLLKIKCDVIADYLNIPKGNIIFLHKNHKV